MRIKRKNGQALTEYMIVTSIVSAASLMMIKFYGKIIFEWVDFIIKVFTIPIL